MSSFISCRSHYLHSETAAVPTQWRGSDSWSWAMIFLFGIFLSAMSMLSSHFSLDATYFRNQCHEFLCQSSVSSLNPQLITLSPFHSKLKVSVSHVWPWALGGQGLCCLLSSCILCLCWQGSQWMSEVCCYGFILFMVLFSYGDALKFLTSYPECEWDLI